MSKSSEPDATVPVETLPEASPPRLNALGGAPAPADLATDLIAFEALPPSARAHFWELLEPNLARDVGEPQGRLAKRFGKAFGVPAQVLMRVVRGCRLLLRSAALADVPVDRVTIDLNVLCGDHPVVVRELTTLYREALPRIRSREVIDTLPDFGPVLDDVRVRRAYVPVSRSAPQMVTPLSTMTLVYRENGETKRLTLQLTAPAVELLMARCKELA